MQKNNILHKLKLSDNKLFIFILIAIAFIYSYNKILFYRPVSVHQWRACVGAAVAQNYYYDINFFHTRVTSLVSENKESDRTILEFPVFYYLVGLTYHIFGYHEFLFRLLSVILGFIGLTCLFKFSKQFLNNSFYGMAIPLFIFSSPVFVYYLNNFFPDPIGLSFALIGLYFFYMFYSAKGYWNFILSMIFFLLAGLIKPPALIIFFALFSTLIFEWIFGFRLIKNGQKLFTPILIYLIPFLSVIILLIVWFTYARIYQYSHASVISAVEIRPIWKVAHETRLTIWEQMKDRFNKGNYYSPLFLILSLILLIVNTIFYKKYNRLLNTLVFISVIEGVTFTLLFYYSMGRCDYYQINNTVIPALIFLNFFIFLKTNYPKIFNSIYLKVFLVIILFLLVNDCRKFMYDRYHGWSYSHTMPIVHKYGEITPYLRSLGINRDDRVYVAPDPSTNITLYLMNQKGNNDYGLRFGKRKEKIEFLLPKGLKYIIIGDSSVYEEDLSPYINNKIGSFNGVDIYKITNEFTVK